MPRTRRGEDAMFQLSEEDKKQFISGLMMAIVIGVGVGIVAKIIFHPAEQSQPFSMECMRYCEGSPSIAYCMQECNNAISKNETFIKKKPTPSIFQNDRYINCSHRVWYYGSEKL